MARKRDKRPEDIRYLLNGKGLTFADVDRLFDLRDGTSRDTARHPHADGEKAIAKALCCDAKDLWPSRYDDDGKRLKPQPVQNYTQRPNHQAIQRECV